MPFPALPLNKAIPKTPMPADLTFMMGNYPAVLPGGLRYCRNHMWCAPIGPRLRFGFTAYAVRLMQDVYFLDWSVGAGDALRHKQEIGHIETSKAESDLFAPLVGTLAEFNKELLKDPTPINVDTYGAGWLFEMEADINNTMSAQEYYQFLDENWEKTQRMLKGHM
jgi:glycine cleavage system H protein